MWRQFTLIEVQAYILPGTDSISIKLGWLYAVSQTYLNVNNYMAIIRDINLSYMKYLTDIQLYKNPL